MPCLECELPDLLLEITSPDDDFVDLIDKAVTEGQIDSPKADLVHLLMHARSLNWAEQREINVVRFVVPMNREITFSFYYQYYMTSKWRRGCDSNPRNGITAHLISNQALSTTQTPLRGRY